MCNKTNYMAEIIGNFKYLYDIQVSGCWEWNRYISPSSGYGVIRIEGTGWTSHRLAYSIFNGEIPKGLCVLHRCDNRKCVNPEHLFVGTKGTNNTDRHSKGRSCVGERHPLAKLTEEDVLEIRRTYGTISAKKAAKIYGICPTKVKDIRNYRSWRHIE